MLRHFSTNFIHGHVTGVLTNCSFNIAANLLPPNSTDGAEFLFRSKQPLRFSKHPSPSVESVASLPYSQKPANGLYPELDKYSPHTQNLRYILKLYFHLCLGLPINLPFRFYEQIFE